MKSANKLFSAKSLTMSGVCIALYVVLSTYLSITVGGLKLTFEHLPVILSAAVYGPVTGLIVGALGEFINKMLTFGFTPPTILGMAPAIGRGLSIGLAVYTLRGKFNWGLGHNGKSFPLAFLVLCVVTGLICSCINTLVLYIDSTMFGYYSFAMVFGVFWVRLAASALSSVIMGIVVVPLYRAMEKARLI